ncbi:MAG TPA: N-acetyl-gamma-glutamyl-phosphate reductase [Coriobacteriia bacterium]|nr:N-acetyl-gamma-glutamyl-phosphate reductase [Coriobacteriia bacterium]
MVKVAVVGAAGYAGIEAVRLVLGHPRLELVLATSGADEGRPLADVYPALTGSTRLAFAAPDAKVIADCAEVALLAVPHTAALALTPELMRLGVTVIDLSADFRLKDPAVYQRWYDVEHTAPGLLRQAIYGLPELKRAGLSGAGLVACPGCYPTATILAAFPAIESGTAIGTRIVVDAKSGVSGAGRSPSATTHFCSANEAVAPYKVGSHRHTPEMEQALTEVAGHTMSVIFAPHLVPMTRGLLSTVYMDVEERFTTEEAVELYRGRFHAEPFVHVHSAGRMPSTAEVRGTNRAAIGLSVDERTNTLVAACAIDNLGKGAAGQAIQCLNAVLGFPETEGLDYPPVVV